MSISNCILSVRKYICGMIFKITRRESILQPIIIKNTEKYGRGIFATRNIKKGEYIEIAPVIVIPYAEWKPMRGSILSNYIFRWDEDKAIALGYGSLYNHSYTPNARYFTNIE